MKFISFLLVFTFSFFSSAYAQKDTKKMVVNPNGHYGKVRSLMYSADGSFLYSIGEDKTIRKWNISSGSLQKTIYLPFGNDASGKIYTASSSSDKKFIVMTGYPIGTTEKTYLTIFNTEKEELEKSIITSHTGSINAIAISANDSLIATGDSNGKIIIWDSKDLTDIKEVATFQLESSINDLSFAYDRPALAVAYQSKYFNIFELENGNFKSSKKIEQHYHEVNIVLFTPDNNLITGGKDHLILQFDSKGKFRKKIGNLNYPVSSLSVSVDGKFLVGFAESSGQSKSFSLPSGDLVSSFQKHNNTVFSSSFSSASKNGNYLIASSGGKANGIKIWNALNGNTFQLFEGEGKTIWDLQFNENLELLISRNINNQDLYFDFSKMLLKQKKLNIEKKETASADIKLLSQYKIKLSWGTIIENNKEQDGRILSWHLADDKTIYVGSDFSLKSYDENGQLKNEFYGHLGAIRAISVDKNNKYLASGGEDQVIHLFKTGVKEAIIHPFASLFISKQNEWVCWEQDGYFASSGNGSQFFGWKSNNGINTLSDFFSADNYFNILNKPEEFSESIVTGESMKQTLQNKGIRLFDLDKLHSPSMAYFDKPYATDASGKSFYLDAFDKFITSANTRNKESFETIIFDGEDKVVKNRDELYVKKFITQVNEITLSVDAYDRGAGIKEIKVYQNGKLIFFDEKIELENEQRKLKKEYTVQLIPGENNFKVQLLNFQEVESTPDEINIVYEGEAVAIADLYVFSIGINEYKNTNYNLNYAQPDASSFAEKIAEKSGGIYQNVNTYSLYNKNAIKDSIVNLFNEIASKAKLQDVFIFYYAGHGTIDINSKDQDYYLVMSDVTQLYDAQDQLNSKAISAKELRSLLLNIKAQKQLVLLDACYSGGAVDVFASRGSNEEKAITQLARSTGTVLISASGSQQFAAEFKELKHGVFTYSLIEALDGKADGGNKDQKITVNEIKAYMEDRVPELSQKYKGKAQYPTGFSTGQDFPIVILNKQ